MTQNLDKLPAGSFERVTIDKSQAERISKPSLSFWQDAWLRIRKNKAAIISMVLLVFIILMAFVGPIMSPHDGEVQTITHANLPPSPANPKTNHPQKRRTGGSWIK